MVCTFVLGIPGTPKPASGRRLNTDRYRLWFWVVRVRQWEGDPGIIGSLISRADYTGLHVIGPQIVKIAGLAEFHHWNADEPQIVVAVKIGRRSILIGDRRITAVAPDTPLFRDAEWHDHEGYRRAILKSFSRYGLWYALPNKLENAIRRNRNNQIGRPLAGVGLLRTLWVCRGRKGRAVLILKIG